MGRAVEVSFLLFPLLRLSFLSCLIVVWKLIWQKGGENFQDLTIWNNLCSKFLEFFVNHTHNIHFLCPPVSRIFWLEIVLENKVSSPFCILKSTARAPKNPAPNNSAPNNPVPNHPRRKVRHRNVRAEKSGHHANSTRLDNSLVSNKPTKYRNWIFWGKRNLVDEDLHYIYLRGLCCRARQKRLKRH